MSAFLPIDNAKSRLIREDTFKIEAGMLSDHKLATSLMAFPPIKSILIFALGFSSRNKLNPLRKHSESWLGSMVPMIAMVPMIVMVVAMS